MNHEQSPNHNYIINARKKYVDTRTELQKLWQALASFEVALCLNVICGILVFFKPQYFFVSFIVITLSTLRCSLTRTNKVLPIKLPIELKGKFIDRHAPFPGRKKYKKALGTVMLGNSRADGKEFWQEGGDLLTHGLIIGTTGAGKTETLISLVSATAFCMGGGVFYLDPKAGNKLLIQFVILCKIFGRIDDLRILNYKKGGVAIQEEYWQKGTNTFNPFALGNAAENFQILGMLIPSEAGNNESFLASAREVMKALLPALCELRDKGIIRLTPGLIADYLNLARVADLYYKESKNIYVPDADENVTFKLSAKVKRPLEMYLGNLQYDPEKAASQQNESVSRSFGYAKSYYGEPLANLAANFGHIYDFDTPEISLEDAVFNNRIVLSMLPAMENPPAEQKNLGKISLSAVKQAMSLGLGSVTEGSYDDIIENLPIDLKVPFIIVADEYAEVAVPGFAVAATQGRGLGISVLFGSQDLAGLVRADKDEAEMIFGNTLNKWLMRTQDPDTTWKKFKELANTVTVAESGNFGEANYINRFKKETSAVIKEVDKIHFDDIVSQDIGEAHFFERGNVHKIFCFYHGLDEEKYSTSHRYNRLLSILPPSDREIEIIRSYVDSAESLINSHSTNETYPDIKALNEDSAWFKTIQPMSLFKTALNEMTSSENINSNKENINESTTPVANSLPVDTPPPPSNPTAKSKSNNIKVTSNQSNKLLNEIDLLNNDMAANSEGSNSTEIVTEDNVKDEIAKHISHTDNHWLFAQPDDGVAISDLISARLKQINESVYDDHSKIASDDDIVHVVKNTADETPYTSNPPVKPTEFDGEKMWDSINDLFPASI